MTAAIWDHLFVVALVVIVPIHGAWDYRRLQERLARGVAGALAAEYRATIFQEWAVAVLVVTGWWWSGRPLAAIGLDLPPGGRSLAGLVLTALGLFLLVLQWRAIIRLPEASLDRLRAQLAGAEALLPATPREIRLFRVLAVTAGICEELVYRGYLIWYASLFVGPGLGLVAAGVLFGLAHYYQGRTGVLKTGVVGIVAGTLFVGTGSLLWPMILHAAVDLQGGAVGRWLARAPRPATPAAATQS